MSEKRLEARHRLFFEGFTDKELEPVKALCIFPNPQYRTWEDRLKHAPYLINEEEPPPEQWIDLWDDYSCPLPLLGQVLKLFPNVPVKSFLAKPLGDFKLREDFTPWEHQAQAVEAAVKLPWGVIEAGTGSGKTKLMMYLIARLGYRALFIVPSVRLMDQAIADAREVMDCSIGRIGEGKKTEGDLVVATVQSLYNMDLSMERDKYGTVVADEVDMYPMAWRKVLHGFNSLHRYGDTATFSRGDGGHDILTALLGPIIYKVPSEELVAKGILIRPFVEWVETNCSVRKNYHIAERPILIRELSRNHVRNKVLADTVRKWAPGKRVIVLSDRVDHLEKLRLLLEDLNPIVYHAQVLDPKTGSKPTPKRKTQIQLETLQKIRDQEESITLATFQSAGRGTNIPKWDVLVVALPFQSRTRASQVLGRIARKAQGKDSSTIIDFRDLAHNCPLLEVMYLARDSAYKTAI